MTLLSWTNSVSPHQSSCDGTVAGLDELHVAGNLVAASVCVLASPLSDRAIGIDERLVLSISVTMVLLASPASNDGIRARLVFHVRARRHARERADVRPGRLPFLGSRCAFRLRPARRFLLPAL